MKKLLALLFVLALTGLAHADGIYTATFDGVSYSMNVSGNTATLTVDSTNCTAGPNCYLGDVSMKWGSSFTSITSSSSSGSGYTAQQGQVTGNGCNTSSSGFVCFTTSTGQAEGIYTFTATVSGFASSTDLPHIQAALYSGTQVDNAKTQISKPSIDLPLSQVPEPASLALLGSGLVGVGGFLRRTIVR